MRALLVCSFVATLSVTVSSAPAEDPATSTSAGDLAAAVKRLAEAPNYAWTTELRVVNSSIPRMANGATTPTEGASERDGFTFINHKVGEAWQPAAKLGGHEVTRDPEGNWISWDEAFARLGTSGVANVRVKAAPSDPSHPAQHWNEVGTGRLAPVAELGQLLPKARHVVRTGDGLTFDLDVEDALAILPFYTPVARRPNGNAAPMPTGVAATVTLWLSGGLPERYVVRVEGKLIDRRGDNVSVSRTANVTISGIGTTKVDLPESAKQKLRNLAR